VWPVIFLDAIVCKVRDSGMVKNKAAHLAVGMGFLDAGLPVDAALAARRVITEHGRALAVELTELFRTLVWPHLVASGQPPELITAMIERFKPLTVQALVTSYEEAVDDEKRRTVRRRANERD
jgi:hypothetical protein